MKVKLLKQIRKEFEIKYFSNEHNEKLIYLKGYESNTIHFCNNVKEAINAFQFYGSRWLQNTIEEVLAKKINNKNHDKIKKDRLLRNSKLQRQTKNLLCLFGTRKRYKNRICRL